MGEANPGSGKATAGKGETTWWGMRWAAGRPCRDTERGAGRALSVEEDALVLRGQVSNRQGNTRSPCAEAAGGREQRAHTARWEEQGGWQGEEDSRREGGFGEGNRPRHRAGQVPKGLERGAVRREKGPGGGRPHQNYLIK